MRILLLAFAAFLFLTSNGQSNALDFDGSNDLATANAQSYIAGSAISMTLWVNPTKNGGPYGFAGFRNNSSADFYLLQLNNTTLEARFRNSFGTNYDVVSTSLSMNSWQQFVMTYDGTRLRLYKNGSIVDSVNASGSIANGSGTFYLGGLPWSTSYFRLDGRLDDVSLWNKTLSPAEVACIYDYGIDTSDAGLQIYYPFDQGKAGQNNSGINTLTDIMGNQNASMSSFSLSGSSSNWVSGVNVHTYVNTTICEGDSVLFNGEYRKEKGKFYQSYQVSNCDSIVQLILDVKKADTIRKSHRICLGDSVEFNGSYLKQEGTYMTTNANRFGCDSTSIKVIDVDTVNVQIGRGGGTLYSFAQNATYQWYSCSGDSIIGGETGQNYVFPTHGGYAVIVTQNNCTDTSDCIYTALGLDGNELSRLRMFPNPAKDLLNIVGLDQPALISIFDVTMRAVKSMRIEKDGQVSLSGLNPGSYFVKVRSGDQVRTERLLIQ